MLQLGICPTGRIVITKEKKIARNGPRSEKKKTNLNRIDLVASFQTRFKIKINSLRVVVPFRQTILESADLKIGGFKGRKDRNC